MGFEPTAPAGERPQTYALDRAGTGNEYLKMLILAALVSQQFAIYF
jgi:hypothetical protein